MNREPAPHTLFPAGRGGPRLATRMIATGADGSPRKGAMSPHPQSRCGGRREDDQLAVVERRALRAADSFNKRKGFSLSHMLEGLGSDVRAHGSSTGAGSRAVNRLAAQAFWAVPQRSARGTTSATAHYNLACALRWETRRF